MAKIDLPKGIASISGTLSKNNYGKLLAKTFKRADGTTFTRLYSMPNTQRSTPVSPKELAIRGRFEQAAKECAALSDKQKARYAREWEKHNYTFNGKKYGTLRGYIIARLLHDINNPSTGR